MLTFWILNESNIWQRIIIFEKWRYCWNYRPSKLLLHFIEYRLDQLNNKHTKTAVNSTIQFFESRNQKKYLVKFLSFFRPSTTIWRPCKIFAKLNENYLVMVNIFKLDKCQTFVSLKMDNMSKIWFAIKKFSLWKSLVYDKRTVENAIL